MRTLELKSRIRLVEDNGNISVVQVFVWPEMSCAGNLKKFSLMLHEADLPEMNSRQFAFYREIVAELDHRTGVLTPDGENDLSIPIFRLPTVEQMKEWIPAAIQIVLKTMPLALPNEKITEEKER